MTTPPPPPPPPGWYPDPGGTNTQRYFDGTKWTEPRVPFNQPSGPATPAAARKKRKWPFALGVVVFLIIVGHSCGGSDQGKNTPTSATATSSAAAGPATTTTQGPQPPAGATFDVHPGTGDITPVGDIVTAKFKIRENLTEGLTKDGARIDTMSILKYAQAEYPNLAEVTVYGSADMTDKYGNSKDEQVVTLVYTRATLDKIHWGGMDFKDIWNIADSRMVHPAFQY